MFSKTPDKTTKQAVIKRNTYPNFLYIPVKQIISEEGDVSIYRKGKDYIIKPADEKEVMLKKRVKCEAHSLVQRTNINGIMLSAADRKKNLFDRIFKDAYGFREWKTVCRDKPL